MRVRVKRKLKQIKRRGTIWLRGRPFKYFGLALEETRAKAFGHACASELEILKPSILWINDYNASRVVRDCPAVVPKHTVYDAHELWTHRNRPFLKGSFARYARVAITGRELDLIRRCSSVVTVTTGIQRVLEARHQKFTGSGARRNSHGITPSFAVVRNIPIQPKTRRRPATRVRSAMERHESTETLGVKPMEIFYSGLITENRCLAELIYAIADLRIATSSPPIRINLLGRESGDTLSRLSRVATTLEVPLIHHDPVESSQVVPTLRAYADLCFVGVFPEVESYRLALPNKFFEAMFSMRYVLFPALPEMMREAEGQPGMRDFSPTSVASLSMALTEALPFAGETFDRNLQQFDDTAIVLQALEGHPKEFFN